MNKTKRITAYLYFFLVAAIVFISCYPAYAAEGDESAANTFEPSVKLESFRVVEGNLIAGEKVKLEFDFANTSGTYGISDILITYSTDSRSIFTTYGEPNTSYIETILPGEVVKVQKDFNLSSSAGETTELRMTIRYKNFNNATIVADTAVYIPVINTNSISSTINIASMAYYNTPMVITGYYENISNHSLYNFEVVFTGDIVGETKSAFIGDIIAGEQVSILEYILFDSVGENKQLSVSINFSDEYGNKFSLPASTRSVTVVEAQGGNAVNANKNQENAPVGIYIPALIFALMVVCGAVIFKIARGQNK